MRHFGTLVVVALILGLAGCATPRSEQGTPTVVHTFVYVYGEGNTLTTRVDASGDVAGSADQDAAASPTVTTEAEIPPLGAPR